MDIDVELEFDVEEPEAIVLLSALRQKLPTISWSNLRKLLQARRVAVNGVVCVDEGRQLTVGERVEVVRRPLAPPPSSDDVTIRFVDRHIVVVEKPPGMITIRPKPERKWSRQRRFLQPTMDESVALLIARHASERSTRGGRVHTPRLFPVHRLDRDTSGLVVIARDQNTQRSLIEQFAKRDAGRAYLALVPGRFRNRTLTDAILRDRGDGIRGTTSDEDEGQSAVTHVELLRSINGYSELLCRLETGRTNQIRVHLAESGHPILGDRKYRGPLRAPQKDQSGCPRLALHASELSFQHPETREQLIYHWAWPAPMIRFIKKLESSGR